MNCAIKSSHDRVDTGTWFSLYDPNANDFFHDYLITRSDYDPFPLLGPTTK
jgi:hypothetical protein